jgi:hypothetical protein
MQLKHFNKYSKISQVGQKCLLILNSHRSHYTKEFIQYYDGNNIIPFSMPPNLIYLLQPLDVIVFRLARSDQETIDWID